MIRRQFWDRYTRAYDVVNTVSEYRAYLDGIARRLCTSPGELVLDAGSGTGNLSMRMRRLGAKVVSMDFSPVALAIHRSKEPSAVQVEASLEAPLPFPDGIFNSVACTSVLFAISEAGARSALREFRRVLKPGGRLLVTVAMPRMSVLRLGWAHVVDRFRSQPFRSFLREIRRTFWGMFSATGYSLRLRRLRGRGGWRRFARPELLGEVSAAGFSCLQWTTTYGDRFQMVEATSPAPAPAFMPQADSGNDSRASPAKAARMEV